LTYVLPSNDKALFLSVRNILSFNQVLEVLVILLKMLSFNMKLHYLFYCVYAAQFCRVILALGELALPKLIQSTVD